MDWYSKDFTDEEKEQFRIGFGNNPMGTPFDRFISGFESGFSDSNRERSVIDVLQLFLNNFTQNKIRPQIIEKIRTKAVSIISNQSISVLDLHFYYLADIQYCKWQMCTNAEYKNEYVKACMNQIELAKKAKNAFINEWHSIPAHTGFFELFDYYEKNGMYDEAMSLRERCFNEWNNAVCMDFSFKRSLKILIKSGLFEKATYILKLARQQDPNLENTWKRYEKQLKKGGSFKL